MNSRRTAGVVCGILALAAILAMCVLSAGGGVLYFARLNTGRLAAATATATPVPSDTPTLMLPLQPPTALPTAILEVAPTDTPTRPPLLLTATPTPSPTASPTHTLAPTNTTAATPTQRPQPTPTATVAQPAADTPSPAPSVEPFWPIGTRVELSPQGSGVTGLAVLFAPRQFTMVNFNYDGRCPVTDIRLGMQGFPKPPVAVLQYLEARPYASESFDVPVPPDLAAGSADALFVYCDSRDEMLAWGPLTAPAY